MLSNNQKQRGFSLFEVMLVIALLSLLLASFFNVAGIINKNIHHSRILIQVLSQGISSAHILGKLLDRGIAPVLFSDDIKDFSCSEQELFGFEKKTICSFKIGNKDFIFSSFQK